LLDGDIAELASLLGRAVAGPPPVIDGALDALARLANALPTALYTQAGDPDYQLRCIELCGVLEVIPVDRVCICERKTEERFRQTLTEFAIADPAAVWMIGNSMRSDINPALQAGANAILVEVADPWEFDLVEPVSDAFHRVSSFDQAVNLLLPLSE
jgi:putative hydrolase of the HAD superfamily